MTDSRALMVVNAILADIWNRRGFRQTLDETDDDIKAEIVAAWVKAIDEAYRAHPLSKLEAAVVEAVGPLLARWELFTGPERNGWGNQEQAYYDLAKHAFKEWQALAQPFAALQAEREKQDG